MTVAAGILTVAGDDGLCGDFGIPLSFRFQSEVIGILHVGIHIAVDQLQIVVAVRACGIAQIQYGNFEAIVIFGDTCVVAEQIALGVGAEETHTGSTGIFDIGV